MNLNKKIAVGVVVATGAGAASAQTATTFDVSAIVTVLTAAGVAAASLGIAYLTVVAGIKTYKLLRSAI